MQLLLKIAFLITVGTHIMADFEIIYDLLAQRRNELHDLYQQMWWTNTRTMDDVDVILANSLAIGIVDVQINRLIGFLRIVTDQFKYAFIFDVLLEESYRGKGLGKLLMQKALEHPSLNRVTVFELHCLPDVAPFYAKFGFKEDFENLKALRLKRLHI